MADVDRLSPLNNSPASAGGILSPSVHHRRVSGGFQRTHSALRHRPGEMGLAPITITTAFGIYARPYSQRC